MQIEIIDQVVRRRGGGGDGNDLLKLLTQHIEDPKNSRWNLSV